MKQVNLLVHEDNVFKEDWIFNTFENNLILHNVTSEILNQIERAKRIDRNIILNIGNDWVSFIVNPHNILTEQ